jgi:DNA-directed RNA polymerase specialized sigma24 family protein
VDGEVIRAALAELPKRMRAAVVLRHWLDLSVEETASLLDCSEAQSKPDRQGHCPAARPAGRRCRGQRPHPQHAAR